MNASSTPRMAHRFLDMKAEIEQTGFLSDVCYGAFLEEIVRSVDDAATRAHTIKMLERWRQQYGVYRMVERAAELLASQAARPNMLFLRSETDLQLLNILMQKHRLDTRLFRGFLVADEFWSRCTSDRFATLPASQASTWRDNEGTTVVTLSGDRPFRDGGADCGNDYLERFIDFRRFENVREILESHQDTIDVLYPLYREIHTAAIMAKCVQQKDRRLRSISLSPTPLLNADFDMPLVEPFFYLWPLLFRMIDPALVHLNVGWGIQALAMAPFLPNSRRMLIDFYEVLSFLPDAFFEHTHSTAEQVRHAEAYFFQTYDHIMHLCSDETSVRLAEKYGGDKSIVSVTEYLQKPLYDSPPRADGEIRLVYGGAMLAANSPDNFYYHPFLNAVPHYTRENLRLYIYNSPFLDGTGENKGLKDFIRTHGFANVHACKPLKLDEFTKQITEYDYGVFLLTAKDLNAPDTYNYFMATKFLTYLQAGLPIVIDSGYSYMAGLVERYNIGVVLRDGDLERLPEILNSVDLPALKSNVVKFREEFSIEKGGEKVLKMYHDILRKAGDRPTRSVSTVKTPSPAACMTVPATSHRMAAGHCPDSVIPAPGRNPEVGACDGAGEVDSRSRGNDNSTIPGLRGSTPHAPGRADFEEMIEVMARRENRLYYRDQSARTMVSLSALARQFNPSVVIELGTLGGLSLRTWIASTEQTRIYAVDLSFQTLRQTLEFLPADLSRVTLLEQDILATDFQRLWTAQDRVIFFVDAHDLPGVPIMTHVLTTVLPSLPDGSAVVIDDLWFSEDRLTSVNAREFLEARVLNEIDELQCFEGYFAPYHDGGSFMGFAEVKSLLNFVNEHGITLVHDRDSKHAFFVWRRAYLERHETAAEDLGESSGFHGSVLYNPLESVPVSKSSREAMRQIAALYRQKNIQQAADGLSKAIVLDPQDPGLSYGLAVCLARVGMLSQARDVLARNLSGSSHPRYRRLFDDLVGRVRAPEPRPADAPQQRAETCGMTLFAMPKAFVGRTATIQRNAIRSWALLDPTPEIILFGDEPGIREMAEEVGARHIPDVGRNEFGTPLINELFEAAQECASHTVLAYVNADMILMQDFAEGVQKVQSRLPDFLLIGQRWDLAVLDEIDCASPRWRESLLEEMRQYGILHAECGLDYFVFRKGLWPEIPPFAIGRTAWDNWLVMDPRKRGVPVVDGTEFITAVHQDHDYGHVSGGRHEVWGGKEAERNRSLAGPADDTGLTSGTNWILRKDGELVETEGRQPQYVTAAYRRQRSTWLLTEARRLLAAGAAELAASKCEEAVGCLDVWVQLRQLGHAPSQSTDHADINAMYIASHTLLAQCSMQMGCYEGVVAAYTRLLEHPVVQMPAAQRETIVRLRDRLASTRSPETPSSSQVRRDLDSRRETLQSPPRPAAHPPSVPAGSRVGTACRPKVTVITACHDSERYLRECVESILAQTMTEWELFLIDDGSTDGTGRMIDEYARRDGRIRPLHFPDCRGPYVRRNLAISRAAADFIVIQDADDIMSPTKLERLHAQINRDNRLAMVGSFPRTFVEEFRGPDCTESRHLPVDSDSILASCAAWQATISHGTAIIRKALFDQIGLYDENPFGADAFWSAKLALYAEAGAAAKVANIPEHLTFIRIHPDSQTQRLPVFDPRNRRVRYRQYCECRLQEIREKWRRQPQLDVARALRDCSCSDFLTRFEAKILQWESEVLPVHFLNELLAGAVSAFQSQSYVNCIVVLNGLEVMQPDMARRVTGFDLLRAMALHALGLHDRARTHLRREIENHDSPVARTFLRDLQEQGTSMAVHHWYTEHACDLDLRLVEGHREHMGAAGVANAAVGL